jgi:hypothetical protein
MEREAMMSPMCDAITMAVKACSACSGGLLETDKFCRWCGAHQLDAAISQTLNSQMLATPAASSELARYTTSLLKPQGTDTNHYRRVSGPLVSAVIASVSANASPEQSRWMKKAILALISIPIWLMIVLLSPLDAYAAAKNVLRES